VLAAPPILIVPLASLSWVTWSIIRLHFTRISWLWLRMYLIVSQHWQSEYNERQMPSVMMPNPGARYAEYDVCGTMKSWMMRIKNVKYAQFIGSTSNWKDKKLTRPWSYAVQKWMNVERYEWLKHVAFVHEQIENG
jgi:hypothetical protein